MNETAEEKRVGYALVFLFLQVVYATAWYMGLPDASFVTLYYIAYGVLHLANFIFNGFGIGTLYVHWWEARKFRKSLDKESV